ncbi:hypothetical protein D041_4097A, partial [Vibrio parahaemolyticus EKP-008]
MHKQALPLP